MGKDMEKYHKIEKEINRLKKLGYKREEILKIAKENLKGNKLTELKISNEKGGRELKNPKNLTLKQKKFLESQGLSADEYKIIAAPADCYKFYHIESGQEVIIRR